MSGLIWVDIETTGLDPQNDSMIELGIIITDFDLNIIDRDSWVIEPSPDHLADMDDVVRDMHTKSGLLDELGISAINIHRAEKHAIDFIANAPFDSPMCGSSVHFDRSFIAKLMPGLLQSFTHRNIDCLLYTSPSPRDS